MMNLVCVVLCPAYDYKRKDSEGMKTFSVTDTGVVRTMNQDYCFSSDTPIGNLQNLYIVCDGMGGHKAGEYASRYTSERIVACASRSRLESPIRILRDAIQKANEILVIESREDLEKQGMGTTVVMATIEDHRMYVANVGDSRLYVIGDTIEQITKDHSYVEEMVRMGKVNRQDARTHEKKNVITRAVGVTDKVRADFFEVDLNDTDTVLLCTDGLSNMVTDERIFEIVTSSSNCEEIARKLVDEANRNGGQDNVTALVLRPYYDEVK